MYLHDGKTTFTANMRRTRVAQDLAWRAAMAGSLEVPLLNGCAGQEEEEEAPRRTSKTEHFGSEIVTVLLGHAREAMFFLTLS